MSRLAGRAKLLGCALAALATLGCVRGCSSSRPPIHLNPNMDHQPKAQAQAASDFFYDGQVMRHPVEGTVARGQLRDDPAFFEGRDAAGGFVAVSPVPQDDALAERGRARFAIYCEPCHDRRGSGTGILYDRAGVPTTSFHDDRVRALADGEIFDVITHGKGLMPGYGYPIPPGDRWAIVAHMRRLQQVWQEAETAAGQ